MAGGIAERRTHPRAATLARVWRPAETPPLTVVIAAAGTALPGLALVVLGVASRTAGHGGFSGGVAVFLVGYGLLMMAAAAALWRRSVFARGPVIALSLVNAAAGWSLTDAPAWIWLFVAVSAVTVVAAGLPATSRALHLQRRQAGITPGDAPPPRDESGT